MVEIYHSIVEYRYDILGKFAPAFGNSGSFLSGGPVEGKFIMAEVFSSLFLPLSRAAC